MPWRFPPAQPHGRAVALVALLTVIGLLGYGVGRAECAGTVWWATDEP